MAFLFFALSVICMLAAVHPYAIYPVTLWLIKKRHNRPLLASAGVEKQTYAVCVCAYNEEKVIKEKAENLMAMKRAIPSLEVKIYVDASSDRTAEILNDYKDEFDIHVATERHGKSYGMNLLVSKVNASIVIFSDANVMLDVNAVPALEKYFADPAVGCVCGHLKYVNDKAGTTAATGSLYWKLEEFIKQQESDTGSVMGADGSIFAIRRSLHKAPPADIIDDMFVSFSILCDGYRVVRAPDVIAYEESVTATKEEFNRKIRIACQAFNVHRLLWPRLKQLGGLDFYKYVSHKLLRWFTVYWLALGFVFFELFLIAAGWGLAGLMLAAALIGGLWAGAKFALFPVPQLVDILYSFLGAGLGVLKSIQGQRFQTWSPAQSIRK